MEDLLRFSPFINCKFFISEWTYRGFPGDTSSKEPVANAGDIRDEGLILRSRRSLRGEHGNPLQYSCLENPMDRVAIL